MPVLALRWKVLVLRILVNAFQGRHLTEKAPAFVFRVAEYELRDMRVVSGAAWLSCGTITVDPELLAKNVSVLRQLLRTVPALVAKPPVNLLPRQERRDNQTSAFFD